ncbi:MAG: hypothetical protein ACI9JY_001993 [Saprospiraceae bacterium]
MIKRPEEYCANQRAKSEARVFYVSEGAFG